MFAYILRRFVATIPVMAIVALFVFSLLYLAPGDPAAIIAGDQASPADVERIRNRSGSTGLSCALRRMGLARAEWGPRAVDLHQPSGHPHDRAAGRADGLADGVDAGILGGGRGADGRGRGVETRNVDRPLRHAVGGVRLLGAGVRGRLPDGLCLRAAAGVAAGAGLHVDLGGDLAVAVQPHPPGLDPIRGVHRADRADHPCDGCWRC